MNSEHRPELRLLHHTARSGGTVIARCLGAMRGVCLLSEIHPAGTHMYNPLQQAADWHGLLGEDDIQRLSGTPVAFEDAIALIHERAAQRDRVLLLRDWSHLDFHGVPFTRPTGRFLLAETLAPRFSLRRAYTVRHPLDQWLSMRRQPVLRDLDLAAFLQGALAFARVAAAAGFHRYEDFTRDPGAVLHAICDDLALEYDADWTEAWDSHTRVTGDIHPGRAGDRISTLPRREVPAELQQRLSRDPAYLEVLELLGYPA